MPENLDGPKVSCERFVPCTRPEAESLFECQDCGEVMEIDFIRFHTIDACKRNATYRDKQVIEQAATQKNLRAFLKVVAKYSPSVTVTPIAWSDDEPLEPPVACENDRIDGLRFTFDNGAEFEIHAMIWESLFSLTVPDCAEKAD